MNGENETNSKSVISLTFGVLSILIPLIGLILGILGFLFSKRATKEIAETNESGRGLAISGLTCSIVGICLQIVMIFLYLSYLLFTVSSFELQ